MNSTNPLGAAEDTRPIAVSLTALAMQIGDLETAARGLATRITPLLQGGSPFTRTDKGPEGTGAPARPVRSPLCEELQSRIHSLRLLTDNLNEMVKTVEL